MPSVIFFGTYLLPTKNCMVSIHGGISEKLSVWIGAISAKRLKKMWQLPVGVKKRTRCHIGRRIVFSISNSRPNKSNENPT